MTAVGFALALGVGCVAFCLGWLLALSRAGRGEAGLQDALRTESARCAGFEAVLQAERRAAEEKAKSSDEMNARLQDAFKSLSVDALRSNRDEFLRVAQLSMEKFQEAARGDLDQRQKAIADLVVPVRESLDKVDGKVRSWRSPGRSRPTGPPCGPTW